MISYVRPRNGRTLTTSVSLSERSQPSESQLILNRKNINHSSEDDVQIPDINTKTPMSLISNKSKSEEAEDVSWSSLILESAFSTQVTRKATSPETDTSRYTDAYLADKLEEQGLNTNEDIKSSKREMQSAKINEPFVKNDLNIEFAPPNTDSQGKLDKNVKRLSLPYSKTKSNILNSITTITRRITPQAAVRFSERMLKINTRDEIVVNRESDPNIRGTLVHDFTTQEQPGGNYGFPKFGSQDETSLSSISLDSMVSGISLETSWSERNLTPISLERNKDDIYITPDAFSRQNSTSNPLIISTSQNPHAETKSPELCLNLYDSKKDENIEKDCFKMDGSNTARDDTILMQPITTSNPSYKYHKSPDEAAEKETWEFTTEQNSLSKQLLPSSNAINFESEKYSILSLDLEEIAHQVCESEGISPKTILKNTHNDRPLNQLGKDSKTGCDGIENLIVEFKAQDPEIYIKGSEGDYSEDKKTVSTPDSIIKPTDNLCKSGFQCKEDQSLCLDIENLESTKILNTPQGTNNNFPSNFNFQSLNDRKQCVIVPTLSLPSPEILQESTLLDDFYFDDGNIAILQNNLSSPTLEANIFDKDNINRDQSTEGIPSSKEASPCTRVLNSFIPSSRSFTHVPKFKDQKSDLLQSNILSNQPVNSLTEESLEAYQCALASAAFTAAANGRFCRDFNTPKEAVSFNEEPNQSRIKPQSSEDTEESFLDCYEDDFDFEDNYQDCSIIAEANAEALAFDFDEFYGQEFGFYSAANGSDSESILENGGVFGPVGSERKRSSQSGRFGSHERNLTPITERSEYSNRNSSMSPCIQSPSSVRDILSWNSPSSRYDSER